MFRWHHTQSADLMSYLLFDGAYTRTLLDIGYRDANARIDEIEAFLRVAARRLTAHRAALRRRPSDTTTAFFLDG